MKDIKLINFLIAATFLSSAIFQAQQTVAEIKECKTGNCIDGKGKAEFLNGDLYEGNFKNKMLEGNGIYTFKDFAIFTGSFSQGKMRGKGIYNFFSGDSYEGDFVNSVIEGKGTYTYKSLGIYNGDYLNGQRSGKGIFTYTNGNVYNGDWVEDELEGKGTYTYTNFGTYTGEFKKGLRQGYGIFKFDDGNEYKGNWNNDKMEGNGTLYYKDFGTYTGEFMNGLREGRGIYKYKNQNYYTGEFKNDKFNGNGKIYDQSNNLLEEGVYQDNVLLSTNKPAQASTDSFNQSQFSNFKESAVEANIEAKKAVIASIIQNAGKMKTNKELVQPAQEMLRLQKSLVKYLTDAVNSNELSSGAILKYRPIIENERNTVSQYENLLRVTLEAAQHGL